MNDRIKLAKAMEWTHVPAVGPFAFIRWKVKDGEDIGLMNNIQPFDPLHDANDDYAVLEWMRKDGKHVDDIQGYKVNYRIGDYARAALKVLGESDE